MQEKTLIVRLISGAGLSVLLLSSNASFPQDSLKNQLDILNKAAQQIQQMGGVKQPPAKQEQPPD